jgi:hypothetical protein
MKRFGMAMILVLAVVAGCGKKDEKAGGGAVNKDMTVDQACDKVVVMMNDMGKAITSAGDDCNKMGDNMTKWASDNKAFMDWAKEQDKDEKKKAEFDTKCKPKLEKAMESIGPSMAGAMKCADNEKVKKAMESMGD